MTGKALWARDDQKRQINTVYHLLRTFHVVNHSAVYPVTADIIILRYLGENGINRLNQLAAVKCTTSAEQLGDHFINYNIRMKMLLKCHPCFT